MRADAQCSGAARPILEQLSSRATAASGNSRLLSVFGGEDEVIKLTIVRALVVMGILARW